ncbi:MAG: hypothetical protein KC503_04045 [Myxococcales bacterium]|nr:hypothetical protein [Myxococcales bacterium]
MAAALLVLVGGGGSARAGSDTHYQDQLIGERAAGMGGAFIALANEATGAFYNPAGIVGERSTLIQLQMSAYKWRRKTSVAIDLCGRRIERDEGQLFGFPASLGFAKRFSGPRHTRHAVGLLLTIPYASKESNAYAVRDVNCAGFRVDGGGATYVTDRVFVGGLTYAFGWRWLSVGLSAGLAVRGTGAAINVSALAASLAQHPLSSMSYVDGTVWSFYLKAGVIAEPVKGLRFGLAVTSPYVRITGEGRIDSYLASIAGLRGTVTRLLLDDAQLYWKVPLQLGVGVAWRHGALTLAADARLHLPVARYALVTHAQLPATSYSERELTINANIGAQLELGVISLRAGFFTNLSSFPRLDATAPALAEHIDLFGLTVGATLQTNAHSALSLNVQLLFGSGERVALEISDAAGSIAVRNVLTDVSEVSLVFGLGGRFDVW